MSLAVQTDMGSLFKAGCSAHEKSSSHSLVRVRGTTLVDASMLANLRPDCERIEDYRRTMSLRYDGQMTLY